MVIKKSKEKKREGEVKKRFYKWRKEEGRKERKDTIQKTDVWMDEQWMV